MEQSVNSKEKFKKIVVEDSRSPDNAELGHFTLLFWGRVKKCTKLYNASAQLLLSSLNLCSVTSQLLLPSWF